jgi:hypothetical protein
MSCVHLDFIAYALAELLTNPHMDDLIENNETIHYHIAIALVPQGTSFSKPDTSVSGGAIHPLPP